jgi:hypothetical protein
MRNLRWVIGGISMGSLDRASSDARMIGSTSACIELQGSRTDGTGIPVALAPAVTVAPLDDVATLATASLLATEQRSLNAPAADTRQCASRLARVARNRMGSIA